MKNKYCMRDKIGNIGVSTITFIDNEIYPTLFTIDEIKDIIFLCEYEGGEYERISDYLRMVIGYEK